MKFSKIESSRVSMILVTRDLNFGDLSHQAPNRPCGTANHHRLTCFRLTKFQKAKISRHAAIT